MTAEKLQDKCRGSLVGGAVGDALDYAVEFSSLSQTKAKYGEKGISGYELAVTASRNFQTIPRCRCSQQKVF